MTEANTQNDYGLCLEKFCNNEERYNKIKNIVEEYNSEELKKVIDNLLVSDVDLTNEKTRDKYESLLMLRVFKTLKKCEKESIKYNLEVENYNKYNKLYTNNDETINSVKNFNENYDESNINEMINLLTKCMTPFKMKYELLTYELLNHKSTDKVIVDSNNFNEHVENIKNTMNRFNTLILCYLESKIWKVHTKNTKNFAVPKSKLKDSIVLSNSTSEDNLTNTYLITHMDMLVSYLKRKYNGISIKYSIKKDTKYKMCWILVYIIRDNE